MSPCATAARKLAPDLGGRRHVGGTRCVSRSSGNAFTSGERLTSLDQVVSASPNGSAVECPHARSWWHGNRRKVLDMAIPEGRNNRGAENRWGRGNSSASRRSAECAPVPRQQRQTGGARAQHRQK
jgi:hypothetical protein